MVWGFMRMCVRLSVCGAGETGDQGYTCAPTGLRTHTPPPGGLDERGQMVCPMCRQSIHRDRLTEFNADELVCVCVCVCV